MSRADGQRIAIKFTEPITSDFSSFSVSAFTVSGQEYNMEPNGVLIAGDYQAETVTMYPATTRYVEDYSGTIDSGLMVSSGALTLKSTGLSEGFEDTNFSVTVAGALKKSTAAKHTGSYALETTNKAHSSSGSGTITFTASAGKAVSFWYLVSSEPGYDKLTITFNGITVANAISGAGSWTKYSGTTVEGQNIIAVTYSKDSSASVNLDAGFIDDISVDGTFCTSGTYTSPAIDVSTLTGDLRLLGDAIMPDGTSITIEISTGSSPGNWVTYDIGETFTPDTRVWLRITLATTNTAVSPTLSNLRLVDADAPDDTILLTMKPLKRFHNVKGSLTVAYNAEVGNLAGKGGSVASFTIPFTPSGLIGKPNPNELENIQITEVSATGIMTSMHYTSVEEKAENIEISLITAVGTLTHINNL